MTLTGPLVKALGTAALKHAYQRFTDARAQRFFEEVAVHLGSNEEEAAREVLEDKLKHEWAADVVARGFKNVMDAICAEARTCTAALVAEYLYRSQTPDRRFRRVGALLCDSTADDLALTRRLCEPVVQRIDALTVKTGQVWLGLRDWPNNVSISFSGGKEELRGSGAFDPVIVDGSGVADEVLHLLSRHGFARSWTDIGFLMKAVEGSPQTPDVEEKLVMDMGEELESLRLLSTCLLVLPGADTGPSG